MGSLDDRIRVTETISVYRDARIVSDAQSLKDFGAGIQILIGGYPFAVVRGLVSFLIPNNMGTVESANLKLMCASNIQPSVDISLILQLLKRVFEEGDGALGEIPDPGDVACTWDEYAHSTASAWSAGGADGTNDFTADNQVTTFIGSGIYTSTDWFPDMDVSILLQDAVNAGYLVFGLRMKSIDEDVNTRIQMHSREAVAAGSSPPQLEVTYLAEPYASYFLDSLEVTKTSATTAYVRAVGGSRTFLTTDTWSIEYVDETNYDLTGWSNSLFTDKYSMSNVSSGDWILRMITGLDIDTNYMFRSVMNKDTTREFNSLLVGQFRTRVSDRLETFDDQLDAYLFVRNVELPNSFRQELRQATISDRIELLRDRGIYNLPVSAKIFSNLG